MDDSKEIRRQELIAAAKAAAENNGGVLLSADFVRLTGHSKTQVYRAFPEGGFTELRKLASIPEHPDSLKRRLVGNRAIAMKIHKVVSELGRIPSLNVFAERSNLSASLIQKRLGGWEKALQFYEEWLEENEPSAPWLPELRSRSYRPGSDPIAVDQENALEKVSWEADKRAIIYGDLLNFRGLQHEPVNEQGVVYLFGMVSHELGFLIESVQTGFPDCHGKRRVKGNRWQQVRIEFEFQSRNFRDHGHDKDVCDLIVCWEHNWPDCPLEVISLKEKIKTLKPNL